MSAGWLRWSLITRLSIRAVRQAAMLRTYIDRAWRCGGCRVTVSEGDKEVIVRVAAAESSTSPLATALPMPDVAIEVHHALPSNKTTSSSSSSSAASALAPSAGGGQSSSKKASDRMERGPCRAGLSDRRPPGYGARL